MVTLKNPTDEHVQIGFNGKDFIISPNDSMTVTDDLAEFWLSTHAFLEVEETKAPEAPKKKEVETITLEKKEEPVVVADIKDVVVDNTTASSTFSPLAQVVKEDKKDAKK